MIRPALRAGLVVASLFVAACATPPTSREQPELTFAHLGALSFEAGPLMVERAYRAPLKAPNVDHRFPVVPADALERWARDRLKPQGTSGSLRFTIVDASAVEEKLPLMTGIKGAFTTEQAERYTVRVKTTVAVVDGAGTTLGQATAMAERSMTVPEDATVNEREKTWFDLTDQILKDFNGEMERQIRTHLGTWLR